MKIKNYLKIFLVSSFFIAGAVYASTTIGTDINTAGGLNIGPDESVLDSYIQNYVGGGQEFIKANLLSSGNGLGVEAQGLGDYTLGIYSTSLGNNSSAVEGDAYTNVENGEAHGVYGHSGANSSINAANVYDFYGDNPTFSNGATATNAYGLYLNDITGATNNYNIWSGPQFSDFSSFLQGKIAGSAQNTFTSLNSGHEADYNGAIAVIEESDSSAYSTGMQIFSNKTAAGGIAETGAFYGYISEPSGTVDWASALSAGVEHHGNGTLTDMYGLLLYSGHNNGAGTVTNNHGLKIEDQTEGTNNWAIKTGLGKVQFGDDVTVDSLAGTGNAFACLDSNGKLYRSATACN